MTVKSSKIEPSPDKEPVEVTVVPKDRDNVGLVLFEDASGGANGSAIYTVPPALRERTLLWRHQIHEQNHQLGDGTWVYRATPTSGTAPEEHDPNLVPVKAPLPKAPDA